MYVILIKTQTSKQKKDSVKMRNILINIIRAIEDKMLQVV